MKRANANAAAKAFRRGFLSVFDIGLRTANVVQMRRRGSAADDGAAIANDWKRVGDGLVAAAERSRNERAHGEEEPTG